MNRSTGKTPRNDSEPLAWRGYARGPGTALTIGLLVLGAGLLAHHLLQVDWTAMRRIMGGMPRSALLAAGLLSAASYAVYCGFDLLGKHTTGHTLDRPRVLAIGFVSHACSLSLGPAGAGVRFRLAMRHGLPAHLVAALWIFNVVSNWLGFMLIAGIAFATQLFALPDTWDLGREALRWLGVALLAGLAAFLLACRFAHHRAWTVRGVSFRLPPVGVAASQCGLSALNWLLIAGVVHTLLRGQASFEQVLGAVMASAVALAIIDVPAGLGVTEAVFFALLGSQVGSTELLGALLAYRAIFFVAPLLLAALVYLLLEWDAADRAASDAGLLPLTARAPSPHARCPVSTPDEPRPAPRRASSGWRRSRS